MTFANIEKPTAVLICPPHQDWICRQFLDRCGEDDFAVSRLRWHQVSPEDVRAEDLQDAQIVVCMRFKPEWTQYAERLRWIQFLGSGIEESLSPELLASDIALTNASGVHEAPISEHTLGMMLMFARNLHRCVHQQINHEWNARNFSRQVSELHGATCGIVGLGAIGEGVARRAKAFGMRVVATRRHPSVPSPHADEILSLHKLGTLLEQSDYVVLSVPLTAETRGMVAEKELKMMKPNAVLINIARGALIRQDVLVEALQEGWIGGAGLDVTDPEPLPKNSPLWDMPNVIISPHVSGLNPTTGFKVADIFLRNFHALSADKESDMVNVVDKRLGY